MRLLIRTLTAAGGAPQERAFYGAQLTLGRATDQDLPLPDRHLPLSFCELTADGGQLDLRVVADGAAFVNGRRTRGAKLSIGDRADLGASRLTRVEAPADFDFAIEFRPAAEVGEEGAFGSQFRQTLELGGLARRGPSWAFVGLILALFLVLPGTALISQDAAELTRATPLPDDSLWSSGPLHTSHRFMGNDCSACHVDAFAMVRDQECVACHTSMTHHVDPAVHQVAEIEETRCASCHKEHNEPSVLVQRDQRECASCHGNLEAHTDGALTLANATDFAANHPEFKVSLLRDTAGEAPWTVERVELGAPALAESSNLLFPHDVHLAAEGIEGPRGDVTLQCGDCHQTDPSGAYMEPISMEQHCADCHLLTFDPGMPTRELPHGEPAVLLPILEEFYAKQTLVGASLEAGRPAYDARRPGGDTRMEAALRQEALVFARQQALATAEDIFERTTCATCHEVERLPESDAGPAWHVRPVKLAKVWMPKSFFDHGPHENETCTSCHAAEQSESAADVLMPAIDSCRACHGGGEEQVLLASTCIDCHEFHLPQHNLLRPEVPGSVLRSARTDFDRQRAAHRQAQRERGR